MCDTTDYQRVQASIFAHCKTWMCFLPFRSTQGTHKTKSVGHASPLLGPRPRRAFEAKNLSPTRRKRYHTRARNGPQLGDGVHGVQAAKAAHFNGQLGACGLGCLLWMAM